MFYDRLTLPRFKQTTHQPLLEVNKEQRTRVKAHHNSNLSTQLRLPLGHPTSSMLCGTEKELRRPSLVPILTQTIQHLHLNMPQKDHSTLKEHSNHPQPSSDISLMEVRSRPGQWRLRE